jgi:ubiquinone/menaquinone biosynthesis C-methylase UbiE
MASNVAFVGSVPENYHRYLGPLLFEPYARDMTRRLRTPTDGRMLEIACGTGIVTRAALEAMPEGATLTATDLNEAMVEVAKKHAGRVKEERVTFRVADAQNLPFEDGSFDVVFCQFGVMFFPDKARAMREARRVLAPRGRCVFNVWDSLERNPMSATVHETVGRLFPSNPPEFLRKTPFGYFDRGEIERVLRAGGFGEISMETVAFPSIAPTAEDAARGLLEGTPLYAQLQERGVTDFGPVRRAVSDALARKFGRGPCESEMRALVFEAA